MDRAALISALDLVGDRWTLLVVASLLEGPRRFGELQEDLEGIAPNVLTQRLRRLEGDGLVIGRPYSERPPRFVYQLTTAGGELADVLRMLAGWGARGVGAPDRPVHPVCGTSLEVRWWCPTCRTVVEDAEHEEIHFA